MLKAYFDDSGTHADSDVIVMGGPVDSEEAWIALEPKWQAGLDLFGLDQMHMSHCERGWGEFKGWQRDTKDKASAYFSNLVCETGGRMLASAVSQKTWDSITRQVPEFACVFHEPLKLLVQYLHASSVRE